MIGIKKVLFSVIEKLQEPFIAISERPTQPDKSGECVTFPRIYRHIHSPRLRHCNKVQRWAKNIFEDYSQDDFGRDFEAIYDASLIAKKDGETQK